MRYLHVLNGDSVVGGLAGSGVPGTLAVWADVLHEGPVPTDDDLDAWLRTRARFIAATGWENEASALGHYRKWQTALDAFRDHDEVVLWFEHDLFDQLLLVRHLAWFTRQAGASDAGAATIDGVQLTLICIDRHPGVERFHGLGQLSPAQLAGLFPTRVPVSVAQLRLGARVWQAFTAPDPAALARLVRQDTTPLPFLEGALVRLLEEYPSVHNGLGRTEQQILDILSTAPRTPVTLFRENQKREERVFMGDATFWLRVRELARGPAPLVALNVRDNDGALPTGEARLTATGGRVLAGQEDRIALAGIDRWLGGVHLYGAEAAWRWDASARRLVSRTGA